MVRSLECMCYTVMFIFHQVLVKKKRFINKEHSPNISEFLLPIFPVTMFTFLNYANG